MNKLFPLILLLLLYMIGLTQSLTKSLPGRIEAESYDAMNGIQTENTADIDGTLNVGYIDKGDWIDYKTTVSTTGNYTFNLRVASPYNYGKISIRSDNGTVLATLAVPLTGSWQKWTTISTTISLSAGIQTLRIYAENSGWNINWFEAMLVNPNRIQSVISFAELPVKTAGEPAFTLTATSNNAETPLVFTSSNTSLVSVSNVSGKWMAKPLAAGTAIITASQAGNNNFIEAANVVRNQVVQAAPPPATGKSIPGKVEAESYDAMNGIQTERTTDTDGNLNVGWIDKGDWMDYKVNVASKGNYLINLRVASPYKYGQLSIRSIDGSVLAGAALPNTGGWQNWTTISATVSLNAGIQTLRIHADNSGWNINWFEATVANSNPPPPPGPPVGAKILIDPKKWFQLTNANNEFEKLFNGKTDEIVQTGYGKIFEQYDSYYPVINGEQIDISGLRFYDGAGTNETQPMILSAITADGVKKQIASFVGKQYNTWVGPDANNPNQFNLPVSVKSIKYLVINSFNFFPAEIELYGKYTAGTPVTPPVKKYAPLRQMFGINGFEWNFEDPSRPYEIDPPNFKAVKNFPGFRHYMDWEKLEASPASYTFNPTQSGGWNYDIIYDSCKAADIEVLACFKTIPSWMQNTYPGNLRDYENVPAKYGKNLLDPLSYIEQAKAVFQYAARYGSNKNVSKALISVSNTNSVKTGLGLIKYIECDNERDKWWKGRKAYQTAYEYAANLSAFYDGNKNTMGPGVGVKNADSNMQVIMAGLALPSTDYVEGMIDWCRRYRGYKADGKVDLCWDIINYHYYSNDSYASQSGNVTRGTAPELSGATETAAEFLQVSHRYANDMPIWVTELGYDVNQGSIFKAIPIGNKSAVQTQADWLLRSSLLYARAGVERIFFYTLYDDNLYNSTQFSSSGLLNNDRTRKPAADYIYQVNKFFGLYAYQETISTNPMVDVYKFKNNTAYVVFVPDEKGRTAQYTLDLGEAASAKIYTPKIGSDNMDIKTVSTTNGKLTVTATETPVFIAATGTETNENMANELSAAAHAGNLSAVNQPGNILINKDQQLENSIKLYPNPVSNFINVVINNESSNKVFIKIYGAGSGKMYQNIQFNKTASNFFKSLNINSLPVGYYVIEVKQGNTKMIKKVLKTYHSNYFLSQ